MTNDLLGPALTFMLATVPATAAAQSAAPAADAGQTIVITGSDQGYAVPPSYGAPRADLGPLGSADPQDVPASVTTVTEGLIVNNQARTVNDTLRYLPSVQVRDQQGLEVSRPQSRGFQGSIVQDTRLDGLNIVGTTAIPAENLAGVQVLNGLAGALYGPQPPAGVFDYQLKRPTDRPLVRAVLDYDEQGVVAGHLDASDRFGPVAVRLNVVHGEGEGIVDGSRQNRTLVAGDVDLHLDDRTVLELDGSHYRTQAYGLAGAIVYFNPQSVLLPKAIDPTRVGYGQPGAGTDLKTDTGLAKLKHDLGGSWAVELGGLYQNADRGLFGIADTLKNNAGLYTVTQNFNAVSRFTVVSNSASVTGPVRIFGLENDLAFGTNGFVNGQYNNRNSIAVNIGTGTLATPTLLPLAATPGTGGRYESGRLFVQTIVVGDTLHLDPRWAVQAVLSSSFLGSVSHNAAGVRTSKDTEDGLWSPTVSLTYKPLPNLTLYATYADSVEQGESAPAGTRNANVILKPYRDYEVEAGAKWSPVPGFLVTAAGFRITRPLAETDPATNLFEVVGRQRNWGGELFGQGAVTPALSLLGGVTYLDARLTRSILPGTDGGRVVGVPHFKSDVSADLHPAFAHGFAFTGTVHYESDRAADNLNNSFAPAYATVDLGVRYTAHRFGHGEIARLNVINVGDKRYFSSVADGNIVGSPGANTAYSGAPRSVLASLEFDL